MALRDARGPGAIRKVWGSMVFGKKSLIFGCLGIIGLLLLAFLLLSELSFKNTTAETAAPENSKAITATYVGTRLTQVDKTHATLLFSYDLENNTGMDYHLADVPDVFVMARFKKDGSLTQERTLGLSYPVALPARQRVRMAIEEQYPFAWPAALDPGLDDKLKSFVKGRLENIGGFVLFDETDHLQVELPSGWAMLAKN